MVLPDPEKVEGLQEAYNAESMPDINFNEGDDVLSDPMTDLPQMSEQIFNNMCGNNGSSMGDNIMADDWTQANIKNITGDGPLDDVIGKSISKSSNSLDGLEESTYFDLLNNIEGDTITNFTWLLSKRMNCPEWIDDGDNDSFSVPLPSVADNGSSPWGDVTDLSNEQSGWADFGSLPETAGISIIPNTFTCEAFAAFDQKNTPTIGTNIMFGNIIPDENLNDEIQSDSKEIHNDPDAIRIEQIQSDTTISGNIVIDTPFLENQNSNVDEQSGAQKLIACQQNPQEDSPAKESTLSTSITPPNTEVVENLESPSVLETLTELISTVCLDKETESCVIPQNETSEEILPTLDEVTAHTESKSDVIPTDQEKDDVDNLNVDGKR